MSAECLTLSVFSGPSEPEEKPASGEIAPDGHKRVVDPGQEARMDGPGAGCCGSVDGQCAQDSGDPLGLGQWGGMGFVYVRGSLWVGRVISDVHERLVPPRILEKFTPKKVKRGSSITFSVKVEGEAALLEKLTAIYCLSLGAGPVPGGGHLCQGWTHCPLPLRTPNPHCALAQGGGREGSAVDWPRYPWLHHGQLCQAA